MNLTLDAQTEQIIQQEIDLGHFTDASQVLKSAVDLLADQNRWLSTNREPLNARLQASMAQIERGEGISSDRLLDYLTEQRQNQK